MENSSGECEQLGNRFRILQSLALIKRPAVSLICIDIHLIDAFCVKMRPTCKRHTNTMRLYNTDHVID